MRLTKLEISGFKSFARKTEIGFSEGITAIVGPNGSGKSNIADAVRWVLGEQSAKVLRGTRMEDVIFNGTLEKKAQGYCEVELTFDNSDGQLKVDYSEVSIMRRVYRSGESEYYINRNICRLKDVYELFRDTGIGKEGYSIIGQGKVEEILSNKSNERRMIFEEAAGVMKYRARKEEAERKLENTSKNLQRIQDILSELKLQLEPLSLQSETAKEYLKLRDELKEIELNAFLYQYDRIQERIKNYQTTMEQIDTEIHSADILNIEINNSCEHNEELERNLSNAINVLQQKLLEATTGVEIKSGESKVIQERLSGIINERERLKAKLVNDENVQQEYAKEIESLQNSTDEKQILISSVNDELDLLQDQLAAMDKSVETKAELLESQKNSVIEALNRLSDAKSRLSRFEAILDSLDERLLLLSAEEERLISEESEIESESSAVNSEINELESQFKVLSAQKAETLSVKSGKQSELETEENKIKQLNNAIQSGRSRIRVLKEMKQAHEGYYASVRNLLNDCAKDARLKRSIEGVVAELISVPEKYETAVEMALGSALQNIVTPDEEAAKYAIEHLRSRNYGRATMLPITSMRSRLLTGQEKQLINTDGCIGIASELISYDGKYRGIVENLLGRTVIVRDLDSGINLNRKAQSAFRIATLKGDIINPGGSMTGGSIAQREFSLLGRQREIDELEKRLVQAEAESKTKTQACSNLIIEIEKLNSMLEALQTNNHELDIQRTKLIEKRDIIQKYLLENKEKLESCRLDISRLNDNKSDIDIQRREIEKLQGGIESGNTATQEDIKTTQAELNELRKQREAISEQATQQRLKLVALEKETSAAKSDITRLRAEADKLARNMDLSHETLKTDEMAFEKLQSELKDIISSIKTERGGVDTLNDELQRLNAERTKHIEALDEVRLRKDESAQALYELRERKHRNELNCEKAVLELKNIQDRIWDDYELTYENVLPFRKPIAVTATHIRIDELKRAIKELGDVNVNAIEDYKNLKERHDTLETQCNDLIKAEYDLKQLIDELIVNMEHRFKTQFLLIQENFALVFSELFGGGRAELHLSDKNDVLNCDIEIIAQPPGKKLQLLSLLSGGERALTAIALLLAVLKLKPTAFCVLDEIESSLDDVNASNLANYIKAYAEKMQFILITHRKQSMEVCDAIYGVAMEEKGISKIVSVRFNDEAAS